MKDFYLRSNNHFTPFPNLNNTAQDGQFYVKDNGKLPDGLQNDTEFHQLNNTKNFGMNYGYFTHTVSKDTSMKLTHLTQPLFKATARLAFLLLFVMMGWVGAEAQEVLAGWTFPTTSGDAPASLAAECGLGTLYADGTNGSDNWPQAGRQYYSGHTPTAPNQVCSVNANTGAYSLVNNANNGKSIVFVLSTTNYKDLKLTYSTQGPNTGFTTQDWAYSTDGVSFTSFKQFTGRNTTPFTTLTVDFSCISALDNQTSIYIKVTVDGASGNQGNNRFDNVKFTGTQLSQPTLYTWTGGNGNWSDASHWNPACVPGADDDVIINTAANVTLTSDVSIHNLTFASGAKIIGSYDITINGDLACGSGSIANAGDITIEGDVNFAGTNTTTIFGDNSGNTGGDININGSFNLSGQSNCQIYQKHMSLNGGAVHSSTGYLYIYNSGTVTLPSGQVYKASSPNGGTIGTQSYLTGTFINNGTFERDGTGDFNLYYATFNFQNNGIVDLKAGNISVGATGIFNNNSTGIIKGVSGLKGLSATTFFNSGTIAPGASPGCLPITGDITNSTLNIELGGTTVCTDYDQLQVTGTFTAAGTLNVTLFGGITPTLGDEFIITTATGTLSGTFSTLNLPGSLSDWDVHYNAHDITLEYIGVPLVCTNTVTNTNTMVTYSTIQSAIDAATAGDVLEVCPGTYNEHVLVNKRLTISGSGSGSDPNSNSVIVGSILNKPTVEFYAGGIDASNRQVFEGFYVTHTATNTLSWIGNIDINADKTNALSHITIRNVQAADGLGSTSGIMLKGYASSYIATALITDLIIEDCILTNNSTGLLARHCKINGLQVIGNTGRTLISENRRSGILIYGDDNSGFSGQYDNFVFNKVDMYHNNTSGTTEGGIGDIFLLGFNGSLTANDMNFTVGLIPSNATPYAVAFGVNGKFIGAEPSGNMTFSNINFSDYPGAQHHPASLLGIWTYTNANAGILVDNVNFNATGATRGALYLSGVNGSTPVVVKNSTFPGISSFNNGATNRITDIVYLNSTGTLDATDNNSFTGASNNFDKEDRIIHKIDVASYGHVYWVSNNVYITPNSFVLNTTTSPDINRGVGASNAGGIVNVAAGTYLNDVTIDKANLTLTGAGYSTTTISGPIGGGNATVRIQAAGVKVDGFTITREGNNPTDWNDAGLNSAGIAVQSQGNYGEISNNRITGNRSAIDINNSNGNNIHNNIIDNNHTGLIFRNQTDNTNFTENTVTDNRTVGVLFLDASSGSNSPLQQALNSNFNDNNISGNWYGQVVDRQSGGSLPAPGSNMKNFECNWYGTTSPKTSTANSSEPGYAALIPVVFGGSATPPGGQDDILGVASANIDYINYLIDGTDSDGVTVGFQPVSGACTGTPLEITSVTTLPNFCGNADGSIIVTFTGGISPYDISWTGGSATGVTSPYTITNLAGGSYGITVTDADAVSDDATATVSTNLVNNVTQITYYTTIQAAIDAANSGDVINVCAGTYTENITVPNTKSLTINGANAGIAAGNDPAMRGAESIVVGGFKVYSASTIDGFTINTGASVAGPSKNGVYAGGNGVKVANTIIENVTGANNHGIETQSGINDFTLEYSTIQNNWEGLYLNPGSGHIFTGNLITANNGVGVGIGSDGLSNTTFTGNTISNHTLEGWGASAVGAGVEAHNNIFTGNGKSVAHYGGNAIDASCNWWGSATQSAVESSFTGNVAYNPWLIDGTDAQVGTPGFQPATPNPCTNPVVFTATPNHITTCGGTLGSITLNITQGFAPYRVDWTGPDYGTKGSAPANYIITDLPAGTYSITVTGGGSYTVQTATVEYQPVHNISDGTHYATIQAAIDAASENQTIELCAGTMVESDITINVKGLTIQGAGAGSTFINPDPTKLDDGTCNVANPLAGNPHHGLLIKADNVTIKNLTVDGGAGKGYRFGISSYYWDNSVNNNSTIEDVTVTNVNYRGIVLRANGVITTGHSVRNATVTNGGCGEQSYGILGFNVDDMTIEDCQVDGWPNGIATGNYTGINTKSVITGNTVTDASNIAYTLTHTGVSGTYGGSTFEDNTATFSDSGNEATGLFTYYSEVELENNTFDGAKYGVYMSQQGLAKDKLVIGAGNTITGPGKTVVGSIGVLASDDPYPNYNVNFTITGSKINGFETGVWIDPVGTMSCSADINNNDLSDNGMAIVNDYAGNINATCNWYGTVKYNDVSPMISGNVTFVNYLVSNNLTTPNCSGSPVVISSITPAPQTCAGLGSIDVVFSGGTGNYTISWTGGTPVAGITGSSYTISGLAPGTYSVTVEDTNGSYAIDNATVGAEIVSLTHGGTTTYYATIQAAINAAVTGDHVQVCAGTYPENVNINKAIHLTSVSGAASTIIEPASGNPITISANGNGPFSDVLVDGFTLNSHGAIGLISMSETGNGYDVDGLTLKNLVIDANGQFGLALFDVNNGLIQNVSITNANTGMEMIGMANLTIDQTSITGSTGKAINLWKSAGYELNQNIVITNSTISGGTTNVKAIDLKSVIGTLNFAGNTVSNNTGFGLAVDNTPTDAALVLTISNNNFELNGGVAVYIEDDNNLDQITAIISNNTFDGNRKALGAEEILSLTVTNNQFLNSTQNAVEIFTNNAVVNNNDFVGNLGTYALRATVPTDGQFNWWGNASGPSGVGSGSGQPVSTNVTYCPWLDGPFATGAPIAAPTVTAGTYGSLCDDGATTVTLGGSPTGGVWSGPGVSGNVVDGFIFTPPSNSGSFTLTYTYTDVDGCYNSDQTTIIVNPALSATAVVTNTFCDAENGAIDLTVAGGTSPFGFNWSNGTTSEDLTGLEDGSYSVTITDTKGCSANYTYTVVLDKVLNATTNVTYATIQAAIDAASAGNIIEVCAGVYNESVIVKKPLDIRGAQYGVAANTRTFAGASESVVSAPSGTWAAFTTTGGGVTNASIRGFSITSADDNSAGMDFLGTSHNVTIKENIFHGFGNRLAFGSAAGSTGIVFSENVITKAYAGAYMSSSASGTISFNEISGLTDGSLDKGAAVVLENGNNNVLITNNKLTNNGKGVFAWNAGGNFTGTSVTNNYFDGNNKDIVNQVTAALSAPCNWWGAADYPAVSQIDGNVYIPSYLNSGGNSATIGFTPTGTCTGPVYNSTQMTYHGTIQDAINNASSNDVIEVSAGTYTETVQITKPLTLNGANAGKPCGDPSRGAESIIQPASPGFTPVSLSGYGTSDNVTIDGFEITGSSSNYGIYCGADGPSGLTIKNNNIHDIGTLRGSNNVHAINFRVNNPSPSNITIEDNCITDVLNDTNIALGNSAGIWVGQSTANGVVTNLSIKKNKISNIKSYASGKTSTGITIEAAWGAGTGGVQAPVIELNDITNIVGVNSDALAVNLAGKTPGGATVKNNFIDNVTSSAAAVGVAVASSNTGTASIVVNDNSFTNMAYAIGNATGTSFNAECNWYGGTSHAVVMAKIAGTMDYISWLVDGTDDNGSAPGFLPAAGACTGTPVVIDAITSTAQTCGATDGTITVDFSGGTANYTVNWAGIASGSQGGITGTSYTITNLASGAYSFTVTDANGSTASGTATVGSAPVTLTHGGTVTYHATIQGAVNAADAGGGDIIDVCAGTYNEEVTINKPLTLRGAQYGVDPRPSVSSARQADGTGEAVVQAANNKTVLTISAANVVIDGLLFRQTGGSGSAPAINQTTNYSGIQFRNNIVTQTSVANAMRLYGGTGYRIEQNYLTNIAGEGIVLRNGNNQAIAATDQKIKNNDITDLRGVAGGAINTYGETDLEISGNIIEAKYQGLSIGADGAAYYKMYDINVHNNNISVEMPVSGSSVMYGVIVNGLSDGISINDNMIQQSGGNVSSFPLIRIGWDNIVASNINPENLIISENSLVKNVGGGAHIYVSNNLTYPIAATCNWFGSAFAGDVQTRISDNSAGHVLTYLPFLNDGTDTDGGAVGFVPTAGACTGCPDGLLVTNSNTGETFCSIQAAIDDSDTEDGHTLVVGPGVYAENIDVTKEVTILGPNAGVDACSGARDPEAIIVPAIDNPSTGVIFYVMASNVTIDGLTIDGDNPNLNAGYLGTAGADINATEAITVYEDNINNLTVKNNIITNLSYAGVTIYGNSTSAPATSGHSVTNNKISHLGNYSAPVSGDNFWGMGVLLYNSQYTYVADNCIEDVRSGIQTGNFTKANPGGSQYQVIENNTIEGRRSGIFHNGFYPAASPYTIKNNSITGLTNVNESVFWNGILLTVQRGATNILQDNTIDGSGITGLLRTGIMVWDGTANSLITGGTITGTDVGINVNNYEGYLSGVNAQNTTADIKGVTIVDASYAGIKVHDNPSNSNGATVSATIGDGNTITGSPIGVWIVGSDATASIANNNFTGNTTDIQADATAGAVTANYNNLSGSSFGINNLSAITLDGKHNYWNDADDSGPGSVGSGTGVHVSTNVDFCPWLDDAAPTGVDVNAAGGAIAVTDASGNTMNDGVVCSGNEIKLEVTGAQAGSTYLWSTSETTAAITLYPTASATYSVTVSYGGCSTVLNYNITVNPNPTINVIQHVNVDCYGNNNGKLEVAGASGSTPYYYSWSNMANTALIDNLSPNTYTVTVTDANGCSVSDSYVITQPAAPLVINNFAVHNESGVNVGDGSITVNASGGTPSYMYSNDGGATWQGSNIFGGLHFGTYSMMVKDANGCTDGPQPATITVNGQLPDLMVTRFAASYDFYDGNTVNEVIRIRNRGDGPTYAPIEFTINAPDGSSGMSILENLNANVTILGVSYTLGNANFTVDKTSIPGFWKYTSIGGFILLPNNYVDIGIDHVRTGGSNGSYNSVVTIASGTGGGDTIDGNNVAILRMIKL